jgi:hypothetical protein
MNIPSTGNFFPQNRDIETCSSFGGVAYGNKVQ